MKKSLTAHKNHISASCPDTFAQCAWESPKLPDTNFLFFLLLSEYCIGLAILVKQSVAWPKYYILPVHVSNVNPY